MTNTVRLAFVGGGGWARHHMRQVIPQYETTSITAICEPAQIEYDKAADEFTQRGLIPPPYFGTLDDLLANAAAYDAAFVVTPHALHHDQVKRCLEAGLDVIVEKPMVMTAAEAESLIETRDRTGRLLVVAFQGSLSPQIRRAVQMIQSGELGDILNVSGIVWQNWKRHAGSWRTVPALSGGGFLFDTGAHMLNTISDLVGEEFAEVAAFLDNRGMEVELTGVVMARTVGGILVTINGCGESIDSLGSDIRVWGTKGTLRTGQWGERLEFQRDGSKQMRSLKVEPSLGVWEQFLKIRSGQMPNTSPPEIGLRMARLWDAIRTSAAQGGALIKTGV